MKKHAVITSSDATYGDFLIGHWLVSLTENVDLTDLDIAVIDYGLRKEHVDHLNSRNVIIIPGTRSGHIVTARFMDAGAFLKYSSYDQVLFVDGGDVIFQRDISHLFRSDTNAYRVVKLNMEVLFFESFIPRNFPPAEKQMLWQTLKGKPVLNAGFIIAPKDKFVSLAEQVDKLVTRKNAYGPDQVVVNYVLHRDEVQILNRTYNFMIGTEPDGIIIRDGTFYTRDGERIAVVHNAGHDRMVRPIRNFGYGANHNQLKWIVYSGRLVMFSAMRVWKSLARVK